MREKKIYAIVGMCGSGKSEVINCLQKKYGWPKVYLGKATFDRMKRDGLKLNYKNEKITREKIRAELGMGAYAALSLPRVEKLLKKNNTILVESLYSWSEYKIFKNKYSDSFRVIAVFASPETRFSRLKVRKNERPMTNREEFEKRDYTEIENIEKGGPIARADYTIINEGDLKNLNKQIKNILKTNKKKENSYEKK